MIELNQNDRFFIRKRKTIEAHAKKTSPSKVKPQLIEQ